MNEIDPIGRTDNDFEEVPDHNTPNLAKENDYLRARLDEILKEQSHQREKNKKRALDEAKRRHAESKEALQVKVRSLAAMLIALSTIATVLSFSDSSLLDRLFSNRFTLISLIITLISFGVFVLCFGFPGGPERTFLNIDKELSESPGERYSVADSENGLKSDTSFVTRNKITINMVGGDVPSDEVSTAQSVLKPFVSYVNSVVESLDSRINLSEQKASMLLDTGTMYLRRGIYFYVATIVAWQILGRFSDFNGLLWAGIVSCSLMFLVIEFLAAWFLKQYRSYVDSAVSYLRARSIFNKYLLSYHAINEFIVDDKSREEARHQLLKVLEEEVKWPDLKDLNANDFNFMIETMTTFSTALEKLKGVVDKGKGNDAS